MITVESLRNKVVPKNYTVAQIENGKPRTSNTRLDSQTETDVLNNTLGVHIDYISLVVEIKNLKELTDISNQLSKDGGIFSVTETGTKDIGDNQMETTYMVNSVCGFDGKATINNVKGGKFYFHLSGIWWEEYNLIDQWRWCNYFQSSGYRTTRLDIAIDDYTNKVIPFYEMREATENGNYCRFKTHKTYRSRKQFGDEYLETDYYGSRQSESMVRCYQKMMGEQKIVRFEAELKRKKAENAMACITAIDRDREAYMNTGSPQDIEAIDRQLESDLLQVMAGMAVGCIDFRNRMKEENRKEKNLDRCERLPFWEKFVKEVEAWIRVPGTQIVRTVEKTIRWVRRQVTGTLAAIKQAVGCRSYYEWMLEMMSEKEDDLSSYQELMKDTLSVNPDLLRAYGT